MATKELVKVVNSTKRAYNGIKPGKIVDVSVDNLPIYLDAGFTLYRMPALTENTEAEDQENQMTAKELKAKLEELGFNDFTGMKKGDLIAKYKELTAENTEAEDQE